MTYINERQGTCATVTKVSKGFVVCFIDMNDYAPDALWTAVSFRMRMRLTEKPAVGLRVL